MDLLFTGDRCIIITIITEAWARWVVLSVVRWEALMVVPTVVLTEDVKQRARDMRAFMNHVTISVKEVNNYEIYRI